MVNISRKRIDFNILRGVYLRIEISQVRVECHLSDSQALDQQVPHRDGGEIGGTHS
jgi:hypothetical protein